MVIENIVELKKLADYLYKQNVDEGYLLSFVFNRNKKYSNERIVIADKEIYAVLSLKYYYTINANILLILGRILFLTGIIDNAIILIAHDNIC